MKRIPFLAISFLITIIPSEAQAQNRFFRRHSEEETISRLRSTIDSLQNEYDILFNDYQTLLEPVTSDESEIIYLDEEIPGIDYNSDSIDSLLNLYYVQKNMDNLIDFETLELDSLTSSVPDSVYIERLQKMNSFIPVQFNKVVKNSILTYTERKSDLSSRIIGLSSYYIPKMEEIFDEYGLPKELCAMAIIESAFNPTAVSRARAKGMWQFMLTTGKKYGLEVTSYVDERLDPFTSCRAAAQYLKDAYMIFGDWSLAIASYNCGSGNVNKAIRRSGGKTDFWDIYNYLPRETRGYIPAFIAALYLLNYYPLHGIVPAQVSMPAQVDTFHINKMLHFQQISEVVGIDIDEVRNMNTQYLHDIIPGSEEKTYVLNLPSTYSMAFVDHEKDIYSYKDSVFFSDRNIKKIQEAGGSDGQRVAHKVRSGETLGSIARRYGTTVKNIQNWNGLRGTTIRAGQTLYIYGSASSVKSSSSSSTATATSKSSDGYITYTVRKGDTLSRIASANGVSLSTIYSLNGLNARSTIYPGMKIRIRKAE